MLITPNQPITSVPDKNFSSESTSTSNISDINSISKNTNNINNINKNNAIKNRFYRTNKRVEISRFVSKFQKTLGDGWDAYQIAVSLFIVGKLSRSELMEQIAPVLEKKETRHMHNQLLMSMLSNCYRDEPFDGISTSVFGNASKKRIVGNKSSQYEKLKKDVLSLSIRERVRIKGITKESGKNGLVQNVMVLSRQAMVPKVPILTSNGGNNNNNNNNNNSNLNTPNGSSANIQSESSSSNNNKNTNNLEKTLVSVNDILDMIDEPLCTESYELPDRTRMRDIMLGLARENGLLGGVSMKAADVLYLGLQYHLKSIITNIIDNVKTKDEIDNTSEDKNSKEKANKNQNQLENTNPYNSELGSRLLKSPTNHENVTNPTRRHKKITITTEDVFDSFNLTPHMIQPYGTIDYLTDTMLKNDDDYDLISHQISDSMTIPNDGERVITDENFNGQYTYVIPNKITDVSYLLKPHEKIREETTSHPDDPVPKINLALKDKTIGTPDELNWIINELLSEDS